MLPDETVIVAVSDQASVDLDDEVAMLHLKTGIYFGLNEVGAFVWRRLQQPCTVSALHAALLAEYDVPPSQAADDLQRLLGDLQVHHLIEIRHGSVDAASA